MSENLDDQQYGQAEIEQRTWGAEPIHKHEPAPDVELTVQEGADALARPEAAPLVERDYFKLDSDGNPIQERDDEGKFTGYKREPSHNWTNAERAADDLGRARQNEAALLKEQEDLEVQRAVDELRRSPIQTGQQPEQPQQQPERPPVEFGEARPDIADVRTQLANAIAQFDQSLATETDPNLRNFYETQKAGLQQKLNEATWAKAFEQHPELVGMVEAEIANKVAAQTAQVQQYQQQLYAQEQQIAQIAVASLLNEPEFRGLNPQDIPAAMKIMQRDAPERAAQIAARTQAASQLVQQHQARAQQAAQAQPEAQRANFLNWAHQQDLAFDKAHPGVTQELRAETMQMLRDTGLKDSEIGQLYNSAPWFRSAATQAVLKDAAEARLARKSLREHRAAPPPAKVMKPGGGAEVDMRREHEAAPRLPSEFANAKEAAAFITKVRAARR